MTEIPISTFFYEYRGERYELHSGGKDYARVTVDGAPTPERFPEALEFGTDPRSPWVMLPRSVFDVGYRQTVRGRWHGAPVSVVSVVRRGPDRGLITVIYDGADPSEAETAGFSGNQYMGWEAVVPAAEIEDITVETTRQELRTD